MTVSEEEAGEDHYEKLTLSLSDEIMSSGGLSKEGEEDDTTKREEKENTTQPTEEDNSAQKEGEDDAPRPTVRA